MASAKAAMRSGGGGWLVFGGVGGGVGGRTAAARVGEGDEAGAYGEGGFLEGVERDVARVVWWWPAWGPVLSSRWGEGCCCCGAGSEGVWAGGKGRGTSECYLHGVWGQAYWAFILVGCGRS